MNSEDLDQRFAHHSPKPGQVAQYARIRRAARDFAELILEETAQNPGCGMAINAVDEAVFWANSAIARYGEAEVPGAELSPISLKYEEPAPEPTERVAVVCSAQDRSKYESEYPGAHVLVPGDATLGLRFDRIIVHTHFNGTLQAWRDTSLATCATKDCQWEDKVGELPPESEPELSSNLAFGHEELPPPTPELRPITAGGTVVPGPSIDEVKCAAALVASLANSRVDVHVSTDDVLGWTDEQRGLAAMWARCTILKARGYHVGVPSRPAHLPPLEPSPEPSPEPEPRTCVHDDASPGVCQLAEGGLQEMCSVHDTHMRPRARLPNRVASFYWGQVADEPL